MLLLLGPGSLDWDLDVLALAPPDVEEVVPVVLVWDPAALDLVLSGFGLAVLSDVGDPREDEVVALAGAGQLLDFEQGRAESS